MKNSIIILLNVSSSLIKAQKMSHMKVHSQGSVPFSWEDTPGVSKATHQECPANIGNTALNSPPQFSIQHLEIPLPPYLAQPPRISTSSKGLWGQEEDPFLAAYRECTKSVDSAKKPKKCKKGFDFGRRKWKFTLSCKHSCDVEDDSLMMLSHLPPLPKERTKVGACGETERQ